jgi:hypothetical protein
MLKDNHEMNVMIILHCIKENSRLRIKFHSYINAEGLIYKNVYNNNYNCKFPKDIRREGQFYKINDGDITISSLKSVPFYSIKRSNIVAITEQEKNALLNPQTVDISNLKIYDAGDCVICLSVASAIVFIPCAHRCVCVDCNKQLATMKNCCPVCREKVQQTIVST